MDDRERPILFPPFLMNWGTYIHGEMVSSRSPKPLFGVRVPAGVLTFSRSSGGLERLSDTQKVVGSSPTVRT